MKSESVSITPKPKKRNKFLISIVIVLIISISVVTLANTFFYPLLTYRLTNGRIHGISLQLISPRDIIDHTPEISKKAEKSIVAYAKKVRKTYSRRLKGEQLDLYKGIYSSLNNINALNDFHTGILIASTGDYLPKTSKRDEILDAEIVSQYAGIFSAAGLNDIAAAIAAAAAEKEPTNPNILNNLGVVMRSLNFNQDAYKLFNCAVQLCPNSDVFLTNCGYAAMEIGNPELAAHWFEQALDVHEGFGPAHQGLMLYYMGKRNFRVAMNHMIKGSRNGFSSAITETYAYLKNLPEYKEIAEDVFNLFDMSDLVKFERVGGEYDPFVDTQDGQLVLPSSLPLYSTPEKAMEHAASSMEWSLNVLERGAKEFLSGFNETLELIDSTLKELEGLFGNKSKGPLAENILKRIIGGLGNNQSPHENTDFERVYDKEMFFMSILNDYLQCKTSKIWSEANEQIIKSYEPLEIMQSRTEKEMMQWEAMDPIQFIKTIAPNLGNSLALSDSTVNANKASLAGHMTVFNYAVTKGYNETRQLCEEYWLYYGGILKYVGDDNVFNEFNKSRKLNIYTSITPYIGSVFIESFAISMMYPLYSHDGEPLGTSEESKEDVEVPDGVKPEKSTNINILGIIEIDKSKSGWEAEINFILAASVKKDYKTGDLTVFKGVGGSVPLGVADVGGKTGVYMTLNGTRVTDYGTSSTVSGGTGIENISSFGMSTTTTYSFVKNAHTKTIEEYVKTGFTKHTFTR
ncbi:UNVERIFIED_CONTAM: hypothetical protein Cloal_0930 [Acetivibrio alkalicellulosi]